MRLRYVVERESRSGEVRRIPGEPLKDETDDDYFYRMNRRPGRVMDTATQNAGEPGGVYLNGLVNDSRP